MPIVAQRCNISIGDTIDGQYSVTKVLGEGSFGKVYAVKDHYGDLYALKLLKLWEVPPEIRDSLIARFDMEFETGRIESNYLVHSVSHGMEGGNPYIVMEYCPMGDLLTIRNSQNIDLSKVAIHVLMGLNALHKRGKVHRDLKPENVLVKATGYFALTDFGISGDRNKRMTEMNILGKPKQIFGTYAYMPPEQLKPKKDATVLPTTDIFSFGVMMYQMLTGILPFGTLDSKSDLVPYMRNGRLGNWNRDHLHTVQGGSDWTDLIHGCLTPDYQKRLQTADDALRLVPHQQHIRATLQDDENDFQSKIINGVLLRIMHGEEYGRIYKLDDMISDNKAILCIGRQDDETKNDIEIVEEQSCYISRKHCTLELDFRSRSWVIRDGQWDKSHSIGGWKPSTNGTYVNSTEVPSSGKTISPGDIISIGDTKLRVEAY